MTKMRWLAGQRTWGPKRQGLEQAPPLHVQYIQICFHAGKWTNELSKPQVLINSKKNHQVTAKKCNLKWKFATDS